MTSAFSWQNSITLCPASFHTPWPNLPVTPGVSWLPTFAFQSPIMKRTSFWGVSSRRSCRSSYDTILYYTILSHFSCVQLFTTPWTAAYQVPPSMGFSRQEDWRGVPSCSPVFTELFNFSFFSVTGQGIDLEYRDIEWFASETNRDHSVLFEIASKYCISDSFVDHDGCSISSKGFPPT